MTHTAEEARKIAADLACDTGREYADVDAAMDAGRECCNAYAALLERREAGVTEEVVGRCYDEFLRRIDPEAFHVLSKKPQLAKYAMRAALRAVRPVAAEPAQPTDSGRVGETRASAFNAWWDSEDDRSKTTRATLAWSAWNAALAAQGQSPASPAGVPDVAAMVKRFLGWKLPENFNPDAGISFKKTFNESSPFGPMQHEPMGTNLFDANQARAMFEYALAAQGQPAERVPEIKGYPLWKAIHAASEKAGYPCNVGLAQVISALDLLAAAPQPGEPTQESQSNG